MCKQQSDRVDIWSVDPHWSPTNSKFNLHLYTMIRTDLPRSGITPKFTLQCALCIVHCRKEWLVTGGALHCALCTVPCWWQGAQQDRQRLCARLHAIALPPVAINTSIPNNHITCTRSYFDWLKLHKCANVHWRKLMFHWKYHWSVIALVHTCAVGFQTVVWDIWRCREVSLWDCKTSFVGL